MAAIEAQRPHQSIDEPVPVGQRWLDLVRISSQAGQLRIYLMGQQLWPPPTTTPSP